MGRAEDDWVELTDVSTPKIKVFVRPTSYMLMTREERERRYLDDIAHDRGWASEWAQVTLRLQDALERAAALEQTSTGSRVITDA